MRQTSKFQECINRITIQEGALERKLRDREEERQEREEMENLQKFKESKYKVAKMNEEGRGNGQASLPAIWKKRKVSEVTLAGRASKKAKFEDQSGVSTVGARRLTKLRERMEAEKKRITEWMDAKRLDRVIDTFGEDWNRMTDRCMMAWEASGAMEKVIDDDKRNEARKEIRTEREKRKKRKPYTENLVGFTTFLSRLDVEAAREQGLVGERRKYAKFWKGFCRKDGEQNSENLQNTERGSPSARDKLLREGKLSDSSTRKTMHSLHENIHTESPGKRKIESLETIEEGNARKLGLVENM